MRIKTFAIGLSVCAFIALSAQTSDAAPRNTRVQSGPGWGDCVRTVRALSDFSIRGDAWTWWNNAAGLHERDDRPAAGAVLVFKRTARMGRGHVSLVSRVVDSRTVEVDHTWIAGRGIKRGMQVVDVSPANDWSAVRVWHEPTAQLGQRVYPTYGFILPEGASSGPRIIQAAHHGDKASFGRFEVEQSAAVVAPKGRKPQRKPVGDNPAQARMFSVPQSSALMMATPARKPSESVRALAVKLETKPGKTQAAAAATPGRKPASRVSQQKAPAAVQGVPGRKPKAA